MEAAAEKNIEHGVRRYLFPFLFLVMLGFLQACRPPFGDSGLGKRGCRKCHEVRLDAKHMFKCTRCHGGRPEGWFKEEAHEGLAAHPASPGNSKKYCAGCHRNQEDSSRASIHYTLEKEIGTLWQAFFPEDAPPSVADVSGAVRPRDKKALIRDVLARRCLRCHVYYRGDSYPGTGHGKGCAACHMDTGRKRHRFFKRPKEENCLSCHHSNFVGWDYVGRFEKDYPEDFRAPLSKGRHISRPYAVEWISMQPDIHKKAGLTCLDCHKGRPFHPGSAKKAERGMEGCIRCHSPDEKIIGHGRKDRQRVRCGTCHAVWGVLDLGRNLMRQDAPDLEEWIFLRVQGSSEIEQILDGWADSAETPPAGVLTMADKISGTMLPGLWFAAFDQRRWEVVLGADKNGRLSVIRPLLDISVSYVDEEGDTVFDSLVPAPEGSGRSSAITRIVYPPSLQVVPVPKPSLWFPYHPHTIGKADYFRTRFVQGFLKAGVISSR